MNAAATVLAESSAWGDGAYGSGAFFAVQIQASPEAAAVD